MRRKGAVSTKNSAFFTPNRAARRGLRRLHATVAVANAKSMLDGALIGRQNTPTWR
jgi:hypothetical protein